jgi:hypothetical protein
LGFGADRQFVIRGVHNSRTQKAVGYELRNCSIDSKTRQTAKMLILAAIVYASILAKFREGFILRPWLDGAVRPRPQRTV